MNLSTLSLSLTSKRIAGGGDPNFGNVASLLHMDGTNGSTTFTDQTGKTWTASGNAQISTASSKFGGASGLFDGTGDYISAASHIDFGFGSGDYTVEGWLRQIGQGLNQRCIFDNRTASNQGIAIYSSANGVGEDNRLILANNAAIIAGTGTSPSFSESNIWQHWAVTRSGTTVRGFIEGVMAWSVTDSRTLASASTARIGADYSGTANFNGGLDEVRITKGVARYTANFTPPTAAFPDS